MLFNLGSEFGLNPPLPEAEYNQYISSLKGPVSSDYLEFMKYCNGGEGPVGEEGYLALFGLDELSEYNSNLEVLYSEADYTVFASNGGNAVYAFNKAKDIIEFDLIGLEPDEAIWLADSFDGFLSTLV